MAGLKTKTLVRISDKPWEYHEEYNGNKKTATEVAAVLSDERGEEKMVLRTGSKRLLEKLEPGMELHGRIFKDENAQFAKTWRFKVNAQDNAHIVGEFQGGSGGNGTARPSAAPARPVSGSYTLKELIELYGDCYEGASEVVGEVPPAALVAATGSLFDAAVAHGCKVGGSAQTKPAASESQPPPEWAEAPPPRDEDVPAESEDEEFPF
jgi:hypothetical protein